MCEHACLSFGLTCCKSRQQLCCPSLHSPNPFTVAVDSSPTHARCISMKGTIAFAQQALHRSVSAQRHAATAGEGGGGGGSCWPGGRGGGGRRKSCAQTPGQRGATSASASLAPASSPAATRSFMCMVVFPSEALKPHQETRSRSSIASRIAQLCACQQHGDPKQQAEGRLFRLIFRPNEATCTCSSSAAAAA